MTTVKVTLDLDALRAALEVIGQAVSLQDPLPDAHPLARAEYALDSALLAHEEAEPAPAPGTQVWGVEGGIEGLLGTVIDPDLSQYPHRLAEGTVLVHWDQRPTDAVVSVRAIAWGNN